MTSIIWVHEDCLDPQSPAFQRHPEAPAIFVFDDLVIRHRGYGLKRIGFIYECLLSLPVTIVRGNTVAEVQAFMTENRADSVISMATPCPVLTRIGEQLGKSVTLRKLHLPAFAKPRGTVDLKRFSRYWQAAQTSAMVKTGEEPPADHGRSGRDHDGRRTANAGNNPRQQRRR